MLLAFTGKLFSTNIGWETIDSEGYFSDLAYSG